ncbi:hypothetical protein Tco_1165577 [Tanacetum coccineum]
MSNYLKNQGTWKLSQLKKLKFEEIKEEFDKLVQQIDTFVPINLEATKAKLKRYEMSGGGVHEQRLQRNKADTVYMSFGAMVKDFIKEDLIELYRLVMQKYGTNRPEDAYGQSALECLRICLITLSNEDAIGGLPLQQKMTEGPYHTDLPTPDNIHRFLQLNCVELNRTMKSQNVVLTPNQILTKELSQDMKRWEELIQQYNLAYFFVKRIECARATSNANLPYGMFLTRLYRHVMELYPHLDNGIYNVVDRVMRPLALKQTRRPRSDRGKARHSVSSTSAHHNLGSSSHQGDDDEDDGASRASTPSPTTYLNSLEPLNYQPLSSPSSETKIDDLLFEDTT